MITKISTLPDKLNLPKLQTLRVKHNAITPIPSRIRFPRLDELEM